MQSRQGTLPGADADGRVQDGPQDATEDPVRIIVVVVQLGLDHARVHGVDHQPRRARSQGARVQHIHELRAAVQLRTHDTGLLGGVQLERRGEGWMCGYKYVCAHFVYMHACVM